MKSRLALILCVLILCGAAFAQQPPSNPDPASREQILKMMEAMQTRKTVNAMIDAMQKQISTMMNQQFAKTIQDSSPEMRAEMTAAMQDMMKDMEPFISELIEETVPVYQKHLSSREVDAITAFYLSPEGRSFLAKMPAIMSDSMPLMMKSMNTKMQPIIEKMDARMKEIAKKYASHTKPAPASTPAK